MKESSKLKPPASSKVYDSVTLLISAVQPKPKDRGRVAKFLLAQQCKFRRNQFGPCTLQMLLVWLLLGLLTQCSPMRAVVETLFQDQSGVVITGVNFGLHLVFPLATTLVSEYYMPWYWPLMVLVAVVQSAMFAALDVMANNPFAFIYVGVWCIALLFEVLVIDEVDCPRPSEPGVADSGWSLTQILSSEIMDESLLCPYVAGLFLSCNGFLFFTENSPRFLIVFGSELVAYVFAVLVYRHVVLMFVMIMIYRIVSLVGVAFIWHMFAS